MLFNSMWLFLYIVTSLTFLNDILNGLKQNTFNVCRACDVWDDKVIMSNLNSCACFIICKVKWLPCPFRTNKCLLIKDISFETNFLKKKNLLNWKKIIQTIFCIIIQIFTLCWWNGKMSIHVELWSFLTSLFMCFSIIVYILHEEGTFFNECQAIDFFCFVNGHVKVIGCVAYWEAINLVFEL